MRGRSIAARRKRFEKCHAAEGSVVRRLIFPEENWIQFAIWNCRI
jgi:hypothetical protein